MRFLKRKKQELSTDKWVVFDFDGTIAETSLRLVEFFNEHVVPHFHCPKLHAEDIENLRDLSIVEKLKYIQIPAHKLPSLVRRCRHDFKSSLTDLPMVEGMAEQFRLLSEAGYRLAIISSNRKKNIKTNLSTNGVTVFETIFCDKGRSLTVKHKTIKKFLKTENISHEQMVYIGDETRDVAACKRVHVPVIAVSWGWDSHKRLSSLADENEIIDFPSQLLPKVQELLAL